MALLDAYRVLDLTNERGLLAGNMLANLGADVIQVEPPAGSSARRVGPYLETGTQAGTSLFWEAYAANKRGMTCDLDTPEGQAQVRDFCKTADFLFESELPGIMAKRGLAYEDLRLVNPRLIYVSITPFGSEGPKAHYAASDLVVWAAGGALYPNRDGDRPPVRISLPQVYQHAAADAAVGALLAHFARVHTGTGQHVDISAQQSVAVTTLGRNLAAAVNDPFIEMNDPSAPPPELRKKMIDQSGSGSKTGRSKWQVKDGYVELHLAMGPAAGRFTNSIMTWLHEEGAIDDATAALDWTRVPEQLLADQLSFPDIDRIYDMVAPFLNSKTKRELLEVSIQRKLLMAPIYV